MASGSESAAVEKLGPRWAVGPTEDVVQALMETLIDPLLPLRVSCIPPSQDIQIAVAKQMHAVVLLYNYYHRKQKPELVFLEFVDFCKLAIVIRPPLIKFMKLMKGSKLQELNETEDLLSITEKAIKDACDIARGLDASRGVPNMEGWPISKVAVLLIDSKKENCMLRYGATEGARSLFEKELDESCITPEVSVGNKVGNKRKCDNLKLSTCNTEFLQLGYDVVKDVAGFSFSELEVLETHTTYSLSKEKAAACFYIMQCHGLFDEHEQGSLKFLVQSLQGPLAEKSANGSWKSNPLVKLHQMLPYMELILNWHSGCKPGVISSAQEASPVDFFQSTEKDGNLTKKFDKRFEILDCTGSSQKGILENLAYVSEEADKGLSFSPSRVLSEIVMKEDNIAEEFGNGCDMADHDVARCAEKDDGRICPEILDEDRVESGKDVLSGPPAVLETMNRDVSTNTNIKVYHHRRKKNSFLKNVASLQETVAGLEVDMVDALESNIESEKVTGDKDCLTICNQTDTTLNGDLRAQLEAKTEQNVDVEITSDSCILNNDNERRDEKESGDEVQLEAVIKHDDEEQSTLVDSLRPDHNRRRDEGDEKLSGDEGYLTNTCNEAGTTALIENRQVQLEALIKHEVEEQSTLDSLRPDHKRSRYEKLSGDEGGDHTQKSNQTGIAETGNAQVKAETNVEDQSTLNSLGSDHIQSHNEKLSGDKGDHIQQRNQNGTAATRNQQSRVKAEIKHAQEVQSTLNSLRSVHIESRDEKLSGEKGDHTHDTDIAAIGTQLPQVETKSKHDSGVNTISDSDQLQNALALLYRKRQELYSKICNMEDTLALCEDNVARIRDGREVDLARQCLKSILGGKFCSLMENRTKVQNKGNQQSDISKSQLGKSIKLSEAYLTGKSSCQDLEYTCLRNNWRLPRYLTESSNGEFLSNVVVDGKEFRLNAKGALESNPYEARETAAAQMINVMRRTFL